MTIRTLLSQTIPPLRPDDTVDRALDLILESRVRHLPVVDEEQHVIGMVSEDQLLDALDPQLPVSLLLHDVPVTVGPDAHAYDATRLMMEHHLTTLPVVDADRRYVGLVERQELFGLFARMLSTHESGGIVILEVNARDYSLGQLAHLVEQSGAKVLSFSTETNGSDGERTRITLKLNVMDTARVRHVLEHYGYRVIAAFHDDAEDEELQYRVQEFMRYLEV